MNSFCRSFLFVIALFSMANLRSQTWSIELPQSDEFVSSFVAVAPDGSIVVTDSRNSPDSMFVSKISAGGVLIWQKQVLGGGTAPSGSPQKIGCGGIYFEPDGSIFLLANHATSLGQGFEIIHLSENGDLISSQNISDNGWAMRTIRVADGDFIVTRSPGYGLRKIKPDGTVVWTKNTLLGTISANFTNTIAQAENGNFLMSLPGFGGTTLVGNAIFWATSEGDFGNPLPLAMPLSDWPLTHNICRGADGNFLAVSSSTLGRMAWRIIPPQGGVLFTEQKTVGVDVGIFDVVAMPDGYLMAGYRGEELHVWRLDLFGSLIYERSFDHVFNQKGYFTSLAVVPGTSQVVAAGSVGELPQERDLFVMKFDASLDGYLFLNGKVRLDPEGDCGADLLETGFGQIPIMAASATDTFFTMTNNLGEYRMVLDSGSYLVKTVDNHPYLENCGGPILIQTANEDTLFQDFWVKAIYDCPLLHVSMTTPALRRCFENTYSVFYQNLGTATAENAEIEVVLDPNLEYLDSSIPCVDASADTLVFEIGDLAAGDFGAFQIQVSMLDCQNIQLGQTLCSSAHIFPDTICGNFSGWSGAEMAVGGFCDGDSVRLFVTNRGIAPTSQSLEFIITEDNVILRIDNSNLNPADTIWMSHPANGSTWRIASEQEPGHPGFSMPSLSLEGCGPNFSTGFVSMFPTDDADFAHEIDCRSVVGSFDPNAKSAFPVGFETAHFIERGDEIEYLVQFQNTGTDTAFTVVLRDTLSPFLDPTTVRVGAASHPFSWNLTGAGILIFTFSNILLPDSNVNEAASHGWVSFRIAQKPNQALGSLIENEAAIFFDFNPPIFTEPVFHTIGEKFVSVSVQDLDEKESGAVRVFPNPTAAGNWLFFEKGEFENGDFRLIDLFGREVFSEKIKAGRVFLPSKMDAGLFFFRVEKGGRTVGAGKLVGVKN